MGSANAINDTPPQAPPVLLRDARGRSLTLDSFDGQTVVLAILDRWAPSSAKSDGRAGAGRDEDLDAMRAELRGLGAVLVVVSDDGVFCFRPDDDWELHVRREELRAGEIDALRRDYRAPRRGLSLFVIDADRQLRFARTIPASSARAEETLAVALGAAGRALVVRAPSVPGAISRRELVVSSLLAAFAMVLAEACRSRDVAPAPVGSGAAHTSSDATQEFDVTLDVNDVPRKLRIDARVSLLDALRERIGLTGTKKGCDHG